MMETLFLSNWQHEKNGQRLHHHHVGRTPSDPEARDEVVRRGDMEKKQAEEKGMRSGQPYYKRRRIRGGMSAPGNGRPRDADV